MRAQSPAIEGFHVLTINFLLLSLSLSYLSKLNTVFYPHESFSALEKNRRYMPSEGCAAHPVRYKSPLHTKKAIWRTFFKNFELAVLGVLARFRQQCLFGTLKIKESQCHPKIQEGSVKEMQVKLA
jgi:hypothetical protein